MDDPRYDSDEQETVFRVPLDDATTAWLLEVAEACHAEPRRVIAAILRDVRLDDEAAHLFEPRARSDGAPLN